MTLRLSAIVLASIWAVPAGAQVGHEPRRSPYRDLEFRQELTFFGGWYNSAVDPARVAPRDGPTAGAHYEIRLGGPVYFTARMAGVVANRNVINPRVEAVNRAIGEETTPLLLTDVGFSLNLTGFKSYRGMIPFVGFGGGLGTSFASPDTGGYRFGYPFLFTVRPGIKFATGARWHARVEASNYVYRIRYPETYFIKTGADDPVLAPDASRTYWRRNLGLTFGMTRVFGR